MAVNLKFFGDFYIDSSQTTESILDRLYPVLQTINDEDLIIAERLMKASKGKRVIQYDSIVNASLLKEKA